MKLIVILLSIFGNLAFNEVDDNKYVIIYTTLNGETSYHIDDSAQWMNSSHELLVRFDTISSLKNIEWLKGRKQFRYRNADFSSSQIYKLGEIDKDVEITNFKMINHPSRPFKVSSSSNPLLDKETKAHLWELHQSCNTSSTCLYVSIYSFELNGVPVEMNQVKIVK